jgi:tripartite-type tricarboxylate transporter receptor subunit TctC
VALRRLSGNSLPGTRLGSEERMKVIALALLFAGPLAPAAAAQTCPAKPVRVVIPWPPGSSNDGVGRLVAHKLAEAWGQQFVIDNRPVPPVPSARSSPHAPCPVLELHAEATRVLRLREIAHHLASQALDPWAATIEEFNARIRADYEKLRQTRPAGGRQSGVTPWWGSPR